MDLLDLLLANTGLYLAFALILGLLLGSFLNVVILRLPAKMEAEWRVYCDQQAGTATEQDPRTWFGLRFLITPPSSCRACGHRIRAWENIPLLSFALLRGRCSSCQTAIGWRYPAVELTSGVLTLVVATQFAPGSALIGAALMTWVLIALSVIDIDSQQLPDQLTLPLVWVGLLLNTQAVFTDLTSAVVGAAAGYVFLWFVYHVFVSITGKEGMGYGDFKLFAAFGAWFGWQLLPQILLVSSVVGAIVGISLIVFRGRDRQLPIPFGPYLAVAGWIALNWGQEINHAYLGLAGLT